MDAALVCGRRAGKSFILALIVVYLAEAFLAYRSLVVLRLGSDKFPKPLTAFRP